MIQLSLTRLAVAVGGLALSLGAGAGIASAAPDLGPAINTTCNYPQLVAALNAQDPQVGQVFSQTPILQKGLRDFIAAGPDKRAIQAQNVASAPMFQPYIGTIAAAFDTCNNF
jgi:hemophore-related protein